jgi:hypothetical protein
MVPNVVDMTSLGNLFPSLPRISRQKGMLLLNSLTQMGAHIPGPQNKAHRRFGTIKRAEVPRTMGIQVQMAVLARPGFPVDVQTRGVYKPPLPPFRMGDLRLHEIA